MPRTPFRDTFKLIALSTAILTALFLSPNKAHAAGYPHDHRRRRLFLVRGGRFRAGRRRDRGRLGLCRRHVANPSYRQVVGGGTGHLEVVEITYDADRLSYAQLIHMFLRSIDPTDAGGQFCDRGQSYTTAIFVRNGEERAIAEAAIAQAEATIGRSVVTPIRNAAPFYPPRTTTRITTARTT
jgi:peptide-methionine (S)-S-oxide reductase